MTDQDIEVKQSRSQISIAIGIALFLILLVQVFHPKKKELPDDNGLKWVVENAYAFHNKNQPFTYIITSHYSYDLFVAPRHCYGGPHIFDEMDRPELADLIVRIKSKTFFGVTMSTTYQECGAQRGVHSKKGIEKYIRTIGLTMSPYIEPSHSNHTSPRGNPAQ